MSFCVGISAVLTSPLSQLSSPCLNKCLPSFEKRATHSSSFCLVISFDVRLLQLNNEFQNEESPGTIYAISMSWFRDWENFVRSRTDGTQAAKNYLLLSCRTESERTAFGRDSIGSQCLVWTPFLWSLGTGGIGRWLQTPFNKSCSVLTVALLAI